MKAMKLWPLSNQNRRIEKSRCNGCFLALVSVLQKSESMQQGTLRDTEVSPRLLTVLTTQELTPDQIEIVTDEQGRSRIRLKVTHNIRLLLRKMTEA